MVPTAAVAGFFAGLFGIGGGLITVPFLFFIFDYLNMDKAYLMHLSVGTSFSITILTSLSSVIAHKKNKAFDFNIVFNYGIFVVLGVIIGTILTAFLNSGIISIVLKISEIIVPLPGPSSIKLISEGEPICCQLTAHQRPIISPNNWLISGEVIKSPFFPMG